jgi:hypothetical protein
MAIQRSKVFDIVDSGRIEAWVDEAHTGGTVAVEVTLHDREARKSKERAVVELKELTAELETAAWVWGSTATVSSGYWCQAGKQARLYNFHTGLYKELYIVHVKEEDERQRKPHPFDKGYAFDFKHGKYFFDGAPRYLTAGEALFLYRWIMLNEQDTLRRYFLYSLRVKFGESFIDILKKFGEKEDTDGV